MKALAIVFAAIAIFLGSATSASANRSKHERVKLTTVKKGGKAVGVKLELMLRPYGASHEYVRIGIGLGTGQPPGSVSIRQAATDKKHGYLFFQKEIKLATPGQPETFSETLLFKDHPGIKPGARVDVISAWKGGDKTTGNWHIWGAVRMSGQTETIPGAAAARKTKANTVRRTAKVRGKKAAVRRAKRSAKTSKKVASRQRSTSRRQSAAIKRETGKSRSRAAR